jgi:hypothetical protein
LDCIAIVKLRVGYEGLITFVIDKIPASDRGCEGSACKLEKQIWMGVPPDLDLIDFLTTMEHEYHHFTDPNLEHFETHWNRSKDENLLISLAVLHDGWKELFDKIDRSNNEFSR